MKHHWLLRSCAVGTLRAFVVLVMLATMNAGAQDYDREARWRAEIEPTVLVGDVVDLAVDARKVFAIYTEGASKDTGLVLVHGVGVHPDFGLIGKLRVQLAELGWSTLSIQMPVLGKEVTDANQYVALFPQAAQRIDAGAHWLNAKGFKKIVLISHSMGAWMSNEYLAHTKSVPFESWVCIGITGRIGGTGVFSGPILDLTGENDLEPTLKAAWLRRLKLWLHPGSQTVVIPGADHYFNEKERLASQAIASFLTPSQR